MFNMRPVGTINPFSTLSALFTAATDVLPVGRSKMGFWLHAVCTKSVGESLDRIGDLFESMPLDDFAAEVGLRRIDAEQIRSQLGIDTGPPQPPPFETAWFGQYYGSNPEDGFSWDRITDADGLREERDMLNDRVPSKLSAESLARINTVLECLTDVVSTRLPNSCFDRMMWPVARETAMWLAREGAGLVVAEFDWIDPNTRKQLV